MKKLFTLLSFVITITIFAQAPQGFNYQATVRNSAGALITKQIVVFKFSIKQTSALGTSVYSETQYATPDDLGQVSLVVGAGSPSTTGTFATINWASGTYYLAIELNTGDGFVAMGTTQLLSVPYAIYANSAGSTSNTNKGIISPIITTNQVTNSTTINPSFSASISNVNMNQLSKRAGFVYSVNTNPIYDLASSNSGNVMEVTLSSNTFTFEADRYNGWPYFLPKTLYYIRAFVITENNTIAYGNEVSFTVTDLEPPTLSAFTIPTKIIGDTPFELTPPSSNSAGAFTYTSSDPLVATINGSTVTVVGVGTATITANQAAYDIYDTANFSAIFTVENKSLLQENFEYAGATVLSTIPSSGWTIHNGSSSPVQTTSSSSLSFANYYGNGLGLAAVLDANGADMNKRFVEPSEGTPIYMSFVVKVKAPTSIALTPPTGYFFHTSSVPFGTGSATYRGQVFSQPIANDLTQYNLGLSFSATSPQATNTITKLNYEENYLVVLKYNSVIGTNNDTVSLYLFSASDNFSTEPSQAFIGPLSLPSATDISPAAVCLRQFDTNQNTTVDAIRVSTIWDLYKN